MQDNIMLWCHDLQEKSEKMKIIRGKQLHPHTLSRKGYARYEYDWNTNNPGKRLYKTKLFIHGHEQKKKIKNVQMAATMVSILQYIRVSSIIVYIPNLF